MDLSPIVSTTQALGSGTVVKSVLSSRTPTAVRNGTATNGHFEGEVHDILEQMRLAHRNDGR